MVPVDGLHYTPPMSRGAHHVRARGFALIVATLLCWSSVPLFLKYFTQYIDAWTTNGWRYGAAALFWIPVLLVARARGKLPPGLWKAALIPSVVNALGQICFAWTPYFINPGLQTFLLRLQIIYIAAGTYLLFPAERPLLRSPIFWTGMVIVFAGSVGIIALNPNLSQHRTTTGILLALCAGLGFAAYSLSVRYYMGKFHPVFAFGAVSNLTAAGLVTLMFLLAEGHGRAVMDMSTPRVLLLLLSAMIGIALSHAAYYASMNALGVATAAGVILLQPVIVSVASFFLFHERLTAGQWASGMAAITGAAVIVYAQHRLRPVAADKLPPPEGASPDRTVTHPREPEAATAGVGD